MFCHDMILFVSSMFVLLSTFQAGERRSENRPTPDTKIYGCVMGLRNGSEMFSSRLMLHVLRLSRLPFDTTFGGRYCTKYLFCLLYRSWNIWDCVYIRLCYGFMLSGMWVLSATKCTLCKFLQTLQGFELISFILSSDSRRVRNCAQCASLIFLVCRPHVALTLQLIARP